MEIIILNPIYGVDLVQHGGLKNWNVHNLVNCVNNNLKI